MWEIGLLSDLAKQVREGSRHQAARSTDSSTLLFCNSHFLSMTVLRPTGVAILSAPLWLVCKLFSFGTMFTPTLHYGLHQAVEQGIIWHHVLIVSSEVWHRHQPTHTNDWHREKNCAVFLPGLNIGIVLSELLQKLLKSTAEVALPSKGFKMNSH